jgi:hypothetical protein
MNITMYDETTCRTARDIIVNEMINRKYFLLGLQVLFTSIFGYLSFVSKNANYFIVYILCQYAISLVDFGYFLDGMVDIVSINRQLECYMECRIIQEILNSEKIMDVINRTKKITNLIADNVMM